MKLYKDSELISAYSRGDETALAVLIDRHKQRIYSFIYSKVYNHDVTEDIFQDTFIKVITTIKGGKYNEEGKFLPWVMRIAFNLTIDYFRAKKKRKTVSENAAGEECSLFDFIHFTESNIEDDLIEDQIHCDVVKLIELLPENQQVVLKLRIFKGLSFKEISEDTGVSINTALGRMRYALINLRKLIEENNITLTVI
ncbi:sigma-70 family RNA polymerase sigma factor [Flavobacteriaceae bacterium Ap0902]|nr:sigma-70 family RNA polymerase sigma factor [Flavobacteriaceae bacterium Ap0902]